MRRQTALGAGLAGATIFLAGLAWACTAQAYITIAPSAGLSRSQVLVTGSLWRTGPGAAPVEIRWNSPIGPVLGTAQPQSASSSADDPVSGEGGSFSVQITIPDATPGVYYIVATQAPPKLSVDHPANNQGNGMQRAPFEVVNQRYAGSGGGGSAAGGETAQTGQPTQQDPGAAQPRRESSQTTSGGAQQTSPASEGGPSNVSIPQRPVSQQPGAPAVPGPVSEARIPPKPAAIPQPLSAPSGPAAAEAPAVPSTSEQTAPAEPDRIASARSVLGDVWSGFAYGISRPGFAGPAESAGDTRGVGLEAGVAILSAGMLAMMVGIGFLEVRRRRDALGAFGRSGGTGRS